MVNPTHAVNVPLIVGKPLMVTTCVVWHPLLFVYVIVEVPDDTPVTKPVLSTVATAGFEDTHGVNVAAVAEPVN